MKITDEMVECAAEALFNRDNGGGCSWSDYNARAKINADMFRRDARGALEAALAAAPASAEPVKVKPLPWIMAGHDAVAKSPVGPYEILKAGSFWAIFVNSENTAISRHESMDDAKDAAQADFEERIRSALS